jgi:hypothetical protein
VVELVENFRRVEHETTELHIPEPGKRITYYGDVVKVERVIPRVKAVRVNGVVRYGAIQIILPKECIDKPAYVKVYILSDKDKLKSGETPRTPLIRVIP